MCWKCADIGGVKPGMIKLGFNMVSIYPNSGVVWNNSGTVIFNGLAVLGNDTKLSVAKTGHLFFGNKFTATCGLKLACYNKITFEDDVLVGWDCTVSDTDFHAVYKNDVKVKGYGEIRIGKGTWVSMKCTILKDTVLPFNCVLAAGSIISKDYSKVEEKTLFCGIPAIPKAYNIYLNGYDGEINYE